MHIAMSLLLHTPPPTVSSWPQALAWNWDPTVLVGLLAAAGLYLAGTLSCWRHAGVGRVIRRWQVAAFAGGLLALVAALISPLDALSEISFAAHMVQHLLFLLVAPLLFVLARPLLAALWLLPTHARRSLAQSWRQARWAQTGWHWLTLAPVVWLLHAASLWIWHAPALYDAALHNEAIHAAEHLSFLAAACLLWWTLLEPRGGRRHYGMSILLLFLTALQGSVLGALLAFSTAPWYSTYAVQATAGRLSALDDQQLAGVIMWVPAGLTYFGTALALFIAWLSAVEASMHRRERPNILQEYPVHPLGSGEGG